ncbi:hypothetical protein ACVWZV_002443 [Bradyrhizobium sp. GM5.1]
MGCGGSNHLALLEAEPVVRVVLALLDFLAGQLAIGKGIHALDALGGVAIGDRAHLEGVHFGEIGDLIEGQRGIVEQPDGGRLGHQRCVAHGKSPLCFAHPFGGETGGHQR